MAKTLSSMMPLGTMAPAFRLFNPALKKYQTLDQLKSKTGTVVMFICNHCPFVKLIKSTLAEVARVYQKKGINFIAIASNDVSRFPEDSPERMVEEVKLFNYPFVYLYDETQAVAKAYQAACTPDFYLFDDQLSCVYRGQFDEARPGNNIIPTGGDLIKAMENLMNQRMISPDQKPSLGCNIKWKEPSEAVL